MQSRGVSPWRWLGLVAGIVCIAIAIAGIVLIKSPIDTAHVSAQPTPGMIQLPPTPTAAQP